MTSYSNRYAGLGILLTVAGCGTHGFIRDVALDGPYRLVAIDTPEDLSLCRSVGKTRDCLGDSLPGPTAFQAGSNSRFIVFARHPRRPNEASNRTVTEFYYITRKANEWDVATAVSVSGPFSEVEFQREKERMQLPEFSMAFADLK